MKSLYKALSIFIICMLLLNFSSCGSSKSKTHSETSFGSNKNYDLNGRTIYVSIPESFIPKNDDSGLTTEYDKKLNKILLDRVKKVEKFFNCKIEWKSKIDWRPQYKYTLGFLLGKNDAADIIYCDQSTDINELIRQNIIMPLDNYIDYNSGIYSNEVQNCSLWQGKHYGISRSPVHFSSSVLVYNKDILDKEKLPDPMELQKNNQWTWDAFIDMLKKTTKDLNNDNVTDQWGLLHSRYLEIFADFLLTNEGGLIKEENKKFLFALDKPESLEAIQTAQNLYNTFKVTPNPAQKTMSDKDITNMFLNGSCAFTSSDYINNPSEIKFNTGAVIFPKGPQASNYTVFSPPGDFYAIPSNIENPEAVTAVMQDLFSTYDSSKDIYITAEDYIKSNVPAKLADTYKVASQNIKYSWFTASQYEVTLNSILGDIMLHNNTLDNAISPHKSTLDKLVNTLNQGG